MLHRKRSNVCITNACHRTRMKPGTVYRHYLTQRPIDLVLIGGCTGAAISGPSSVQWLDNGKSAKLSCVALHSSSESYCRQSHIGQDGS